MKGHGIDTGCVLHYKVNPYVNSPTDGLTCWAAVSLCWVGWGGAGGGDTSVLSVWFRRAGGVGERDGVKTRQVRGKKVKKCFMRRCH